MRPPRGAPGALPSRAPGARFGARPGIAPDNDSPPPPPPVRARTRSPLLPPSPPTPDPSPSPLRFPSTAHAQRLLKERQARREAATAAIHAPSDPSPSRDGVPRKVRNVFGAAGAFGRRAPPRKDRKDASGDEPPSTAFGSRVRPSQPRGWSERGGDDLDGSPARDDDARRFRRRPDDDDGGDASSAATSGDENEHRRGSNDEGKVPSSAANHLRDFLRDRRIVRGRGDFLRAGDEAKARRAAGARGARRARVGAVAAAQGGRRGGPRRHPGGARRPLEERSGETRSGSGFGIARAANGLGEDERRRRGRGRGGGGGEKGGGVGAKGFAAVRRRGDGASSRGGSSEPRRGIVQPRGGARVGPERVGARERGAGGGSIDGVLSRRIPIPRGARLPRPRGRRLREGGVSVDGGGGRRRGDDAG